MVEKWIADSAGCVDTSSPRGSLGFGYMVVFGHPPKRISGAKYGDHTTVPACSVAINGNWVRGACSRIFLIFIAHQRSISRVKARAFTTYGLSRSCTSCPADLMFPQRSALELVSATTYQLFPARGAGMVAVMAFDHAL